MLDPLRKYSLNILKEIETVHPDNVAEPDVKLPGLNKPKKSAQYGTEEVETCGNSSKALEASYEFVDNNIELAEEAHKEQSNDTVSDAVVEETIAADDANPDPQNVISF